jgi:hypothetical protein
MSSYLRSGGLALIRLVRSAVQDRSETSSGAVHAGVRRSDHRDVAGAVKSTGPSNPCSWGTETMPLPSGLSRYHAGESVVLSAMRIRPSGSQPSADWEPAPLISGRWFVPSRFISQTSPWPFRLV